MAFGLVLTAFHSKSLLSFCSLLEMENLPYIYIFFFFSSSFCSYIYTDSNEYTCWSIESYCKVLGARFDCGYVSSLRYFILFRRRPLHSISFYLVYMICSLPDMYPFFLFKIYMKLLTICLLIELISFYTFKKNCFILSIYLIHSFIYFYLGYPSKVHRWLLQEYSRGKFLRASGGQVSVWLLRPTGTHPRHYWLWSCTHVEMQQVEK